MALPRGRGWFLLLGDFVFYLFLYIAVVYWRRDAACIWGSLIALPAFLLWLIAKLQLGASFTIRAEARELVTRGLYSRIRHPVYVFSTLAMLGIAICLHAWWFYPYVFLVALAQLWRAYREEKVLNMKFGDTYTKYHHATWF